MRMKTLSVFMLLTLGLLCAPQALAQNTQLAGTFTTPNDTGFNGFLYLSLPVPGAAFSTCSGGPVEVVPNEPIVVKIVNGAMVSPPKIWGADCMLPLDLPYTVKLTDAQNNVVLTDQWLIQGSTYDVASASSVDPSPYSNPGLFTVPILADAGIILPNSFTIGDCLIVGINHQIDDQNCAGAGGGITGLIGAVVGSGSGTVTTTLSNSGVAAGTYSNPTIAIGADGRITSATSGSGGSTGTSLLVPTGIFTLTGSGTNSLVLALVTQVAGTFWAGPATGTADVPGFRAIVSTDLPVASSSVFGAAECDNTTITCAGGVFTATGGGGGTTLTTKGDVQGFSTVAARIPVGADGQVLTADSANPLGVSYQNSSSGFANPMTTLGDIIDGNTGGTPQRLAVGTNGQVLEVVGGVPTWSTFAGTGLLLQTGGTTNPSQTVLNLIAGGGMNIAVDSSGNETITASGVTFDTIGTIITGGGSVPATGNQGVYVVPFDCTITGWTILSDISGSAQVTISKGSYSGYPTVSSIVASAPIVLTSAQKATSTTLTGWTTSLSAGDVLSYNLDSVASAHLLTVQMQVTKTGGGGGGGGGGTGMIAGGALGSLPYQSAADTTTFIASPTTSGHVFVPAWTPSGSPIAPIALDLATYLASPPAIGGTAPNTGKFTNLQATTSLGVGSTLPTACGSATGCIAWIEGSVAGTPTAGQSYMRADGTGHHIIVSINGGAETVLTVP